MTVSIVFYLVDHSQRISKETHSHAVAHCPGQEILASRRVLELHRAVGTQAGEHAAKVGYQHNSIRPDRGCGLDRMWQITTPDGREAFQRERVDSAGCVGVHDHVGYRTAF